jgi:nicotinic acid mononucleotide adenylyltransferase
LKKELIRKYARLIARVGANIEAGEDVSGLVPTPVYDYIKENKLYQ